MSRKAFLLLILLVFPSLYVSIPTNSSVLLYDLSPFIRVYRDGRVDRLIGNDIVPPSIDPITGVQSKDVTIDPILNISARLYLPRNANPAHKIPLLVYYHGGGFFTESAASAAYHNHLNTVVALANVVGVSVNYRLAPENLLPIGYQDSWQALKWVFSHSKGNGTEPWLNNYVDFGHVHLAGDSSGGNIAHNMAMWAGLDKTGGVVLDGLFLNCPHFWGKHAIGNEDSDIAVKTIMENIWLYAYPNSTGLDDPLLNPALDPNLSKLGCKRVLVYVGEIDILRARGWLYKQALRKSKWSGVVKCVQAQGGIHDFGLNFPNTTQAVQLVRRFASFLNQGEV